MLNNRCIDAVQQFYDLLVPCYELMIYVVQVELFVCLVLLVDVALHSTTLTFSSSVASSSTSSYS